MGKGTGMPDGDGAATASEDKAGNSLWNILPSFDPSQDNAKEYADKVRFMAGICPQKDRHMLAPRLALLCRGTAWGQVKAIDPEKLTTPDGYKVLLQALASWEESSELQTYDLFEKAVYRTMQKPDETAMSYVNRINVAFAEVSDEVTLKQMKAFVLLRQSALGVDDKKRVIAMADGYDPSKVDSAMRALSTKVLNQNDGNRKKIYPINYADEDTEEINYTWEDEPDEETILATLLEEGDECALTIQEFEENVVQVCQESPECLRTKRPGQNFVTKPEAGDFGQFGLAARAVASQKRAKVLENPVRAWRKESPAQTAGFAELEGIGSKNALLEIAPPLRLTPTCWLRRTTPSCQSW